MNDKYSIYLIKSQFFSSNFIKKLIIYIKITVYDIY